MSSKTTATAKKSFILYKDFKSTLDKLSDERAGKVLKAIYSYQTGGDYQTSEIVDMIVTPIFAQFVRDESAYVTTCEKRRKAGSKGGKQKVANASKCKQGLANLAESDTDTDSDTDSDNDITTTTVASLPEEVKEPTNLSKSPSIRKKFAPPTIPEVEAWAKDWAKKKNKQEFAVVQTALDGFRFYDKLDWHDSRGNKVKSWKMKIASVWFTDEKLGCVIPKTKIEFV